MKKWDYNSKASFAGILAGVWGAGFPAIMIYFMLRDNLNLRHLWADDVVGLTNFVLVYGIGGIGGGIMVKKWPLIGSLVMLIAVGVSIYGMFIHIPTLILLAGGIYGLLSLKDVKKVQENIEVVSDDKRENKSISSIIISVILVAGALVFVFFLDELFFYHSRIVILILIIPLIVTTYLSSRKKIVILIQQGADATFVRKRKRNLNVTVLLISAFVIVVLVLDYYISKIM